jgi:putative MFS transporter
MRKPTQALFAQGRRKCRAPAAKAFVSFHLLRDGLANGLCDTADICPFGFLLLSAAGCLLYSLGRAPAVVVGSTLLMSFALLGTWGALYAFTPEVYPTPLRASGMGAAGAVARFGGLFAPALIAPVMATRFTLALALLSSFLLVAAVAIGRVDVESRNRALD